MTLTIELPDAEVPTAEKEARRAHMTLEEWAAYCMTGRKHKRETEALDEKGYPIGWFEKHAGALADVDDFVEPEDFPEPPIEPINL